MNLSGFAIFIGYCYLYVVPQNVARFVKWYQLCFIARPQEVWHVTTQLMPRYHAVLGLTSKLLSTTRHKSQHVLRVRRHRRGCKGKAPWKMTGLGLLETWLELYAVCQRHQANRWLATTGGFASTRHLGLARNRCSRKTPLICYALGAVAPP